MQRAKSMGPSRRQPPRGWRFRSEVTLALALLFACGILTLVPLLPLATDTPQWPAERTATQIADSVAKDVQERLEQFALVLETIMTGEETPADRSLTPERRNALLYERTLHDRQIGFIDVLAANGEVLASSRRDYPPSNWASRDYFGAQRTSATNAIFIGEPFSTQHEGSAGFTISRRIPTKDGTFAGVVVIGVRLLVLRDDFSRYEPGQGGSIVLLRSDGIVLMQWPFDLKAIGHTIDATSPFHAMERGERNPVMSRDAPDHVQRLYVNRPVGTLPLRVLVATPVGDGNANLWLAWPAAAVLAVVAALLVMIRRRP